MRFSQFTQLNEGIGHAEEMNVHEFISSLRNFEQYEVSEKIDGSNLQYGIDENGFYTSREEFGGKRMYSIDEYGTGFHETYQRSAHLALEKALPSMKKAGLKLGDRVEVEVLFGKLPNAVPYSATDNQLILLRTVDGTVSIDALHSVLDGKTTYVTLEAPYTIDGKTIQMAEETHQWSFAQTPSYDGADMMDDELKAKIDSDLDDLESYLNQDSGVWKFSNAEVLALPLNKRPEGVDTAQWKELKVEVKEKKAEVQSHVYKKKEGSGLVQEIKNTLLNNMVRQIKSDFGPEIEDGGWIEGLVFRHKDTGEMFKLVDKDMFGTIKNFIWKVRGELADKPKSVERVESFAGKTLVGLATALGHPELGTFQAKRHLRKQGDTPDEILSTISQSVGDFESVRAYWINFIEQQERALVKVLDKYNNEKAESQITLDFGNQSRTFGYDEEVDSRNLQVFAGLYKQLENFKQAAKGANSTEDLVMALVGKQIGEL